ncbi:VOC family protein [Bradymonadaceae bacterium TMQ3]|uniref:VOC family protein n=1 Tax=Lujinxingia sediminis TaxID=2480984 RepID=A0ABY0CYS4_9DELT|nr:VOC family protein [Lujinxingia sediminis]RDV39387.1 VOC family protein [Bradymonadaceae bacterium TMQ3]RVU48575.1 VOC family protein [Lujinxingia sediminis]TXC77869.1 VOC family protein [Bradymonadales bacterium TMQ1]
MSTTLTPSLMFIGKASEAIDRYTSIFDDAELVRITRYDASNPEMEGQIMQAELRLQNQSLLLTDSPDMHSFTFTPSVSFFVRCESVEEVDRIFAALSEDGTVMMPLDAYPFNARFGWCNDRFGVSWQVGLN